MGIFGKKINDGFRHDFSDRDIDLFVEHLNRQGLTMSAEDAQAALHSQTNDDPRRLREKKLPKALVMTESSTLYRLWELWEERPQELLFEPLEFMGERIEEAHEIFLKNRAALSSGAMAGLSEEQPADDSNSVASRRAEAERKNSTLEELDYNQKEILNLESELERIADKTYNLILQERSIATTLEIDKMTKEMKQDTRLVNGEITNLRALGGFSSQEEAERELAEFTDKKKKTSDDDQQAPEEIRPTDASIQLRITEDKIRAWIFVFPPRNGGAHITEDQIRAVLELQHIVYGVDTYLIRKIVEQKMYFKLLQIATGIEAMHGLNGSVEELIKRERQIDIKEDARGNVNYKELNIIASVRAGEAICHVALPTKARAGRTVTDETVEGKDGRYPTVPQGKNTQLNEDGSKLLATIDGEVLFERGVFRVQRLLTIPGDVDNATGNVNFAGDIVINGDVRDGFTVSAGGRLYIRGTVEGAKISADNDIHIERGMVGGQKGVITCGGSLHCKYLENCKAYAKGKIYVETIVFSEVSSDDTIIITNERGGISGGRITAARSINSRIVGSRNNSGLVTKISLGATPQMLEQLGNLQIKQETIECNIKKLQQNIKYIENGAPAQLEARKPMLEQLKIQLQMRQLQKAQADRQLNNLTGEMFNNASQCHLTCDHLYPTVIVKIGEQVLTVENESHNVKICVVNNEIRLMDF